MCKISVRANDHTKVNHPLSVLSVLRCLWMALRTQWSSSCSTLWLSIWLMSTLCWERRAASHWRASRPHVGFCSLGFCFYYSACGVGFKRLLSLQLWSKVSEGMSTLKGVSKCQRKAHSTFIAIALAMRETSTHPLSEPLIFTRVEY